MLIRKTRLNSVSNIFIFVAFLLLIGITTMIYGFINGNKLIIYFGVFFTFATSFATMTLNIIFQKNALKYKKKHLRGL